MSALFKLAGMAYHGGKSREHWRQLVGVDPADFAEIEVSKSGLCFWTRRAEKAYKRHIACVHQDQRALGIR